MQARRRRLRALHDAEGLHRPRRRLAHLLGPGDRCGHQRRSDPGEPHLDDRHRRAEYDDRLRPRRRLDDHEQRPLVRLQLRRAGLELRVQARRRRLRALHDAEGLHRPRRRLAHLLGPRDRRRRQRRSDPREPHLDDRHRRRRIRRSTPAPPAARRPRTTTPRSPSAPTSRARASSASSTPAPSRPARRRRTTPTSPTARTPSRSGRSIRPPTSIRPRRAAPGRSTPIPRSQSAM